jgi:predicted DCC family thiol-disulfide oxidoreductase YuxK
MIVTRTKPAHDTVLYDGPCRFCQRRVANLRRLDLGRRLEFVSLHDDRVARDFPEISRERLLEAMFVVDTAGHARSGATALRYLSRRLPLLWPLAPILHIPGSLPAWNWLYRLVARNRMRLSGTCTEGACRVP